MPVSRLILPVRAGLFLLAIAVTTNALPSTLHHEASQADKVSQKSTSASHTAVSHSTSTPLKPTAHPQATLVKPKTTLNKAYKLHASGLTKRNENSVLKREHLYAEPPGGEYRFYRRDDFDRRRRSPRYDTIASYTGRMKRDLPSHIDADDALALLALWASAASAPSRRLHVPESDFRENEGYGNNFGQFDMPDDEEIVEDELQRDEPENFQEGWEGSDDYGDRLNVMRRAGPVLLPILPNYQRRSPNPELGWGNFASPPHKRFMVTKRSRAPQTESDVYSLAQMLSERPEPSAPLYRRLMF